MTSVTLPLGCVLELGCSSSEPLLCEGSPDPRCATDGPIATCTSDTECAPQGCTVAFDRARPSGGTCDLGADEVAP